MVDKKNIGLELGKAMQEIRTLIRQYIQAMLKENDINLTFEMLEVLYVLWQNDGINQQEIADLTLRDKSSVTYLIDNIVKRHMVTRVEDKQDRRNKKIFLTSEGARLKDLLEPSVARAYGKALGDVPVKDAQALLMLLQKMVDNLKTC